MSIASPRSARLRKAGPIFDKYLIVTILVCAYCLIIAPMLMYIYPGDITTDRVENKIFWPLATLLALWCFVLGDRSRLTLPPNIVWFAAYLALAGLSILWAFKPEYSFTRFVTQMMIVISVVLPAMLAPRTADMIRGVFLCFLVGSILNAVLIMGGYSVQSVSDTLKIGYPGYFAFKGMLGEFAAFAFLLSLYEIIHPGRRRIIGLIVLATSIYLIILSESKGSLACAFWRRCLRRSSCFSARRCAFLQRSFCCRCRLATWSNTATTTEFNGAISGRYVSMFGTKRGTTNPYSIFEFQVFGNPGGTCPAPTGSTASTGSYTTIFTSQTPTKIGATDAPVELGVQFTSSVSGFITGVRFYKTGIYTGSHTGELFTSTGTRLASALFTGETASGWQTVKFLTPVAITANTTYVAAYYNATGIYTSDVTGLATAITNGNLTALAGGGVFSYGGTPVFPFNHFSSSNYWVDPIYSPTATIDSSTAHLSWDAVPGATSYIIILPSQPFYELDYPDIQRKCNKYFRTKLRNSI